MLWKLCCFSIFLSGWARVSLYYMGFTGKVKNFSVFVEFPCDD